MPLLRPRIEISADDPVAEIAHVVAGIGAGIEELLALPPGALGIESRFEADASFVGEGYGIPSDGSREAQSLAARHEALFTDHWYTAKALAGLIAGGVAMVAVPRFLDAHGADAEIQ